MDAAPIIAARDAGASRDARRAAVAVPYGMLIVASLALAALSLLYPSSPTYDPWAWIIWGREILQLDLSTVAGPSWKPLPVIFTTPFALFGDAAPALWLVVARAGAIAAVGLAFVVARRLGGVVAGAAAAAGLALAPWFVRNATLGNSEGLMVAAVLAAIDRQLAGRPRQALGFALAAALLRPEAWAFLGLYALWLLRAEGRAMLRPLIAGIGCLPLLWFVPELLGSGNLTRAADRAQQPLANSAAFADDVVAEVLRDAAALITLPAWAGIALAAAIAVARRARGPGVPATLAIAALAVLWVAEVVIMTQQGYSGNQRYLIVPAALGIVVGAVGVGWALERLAGHARAAIAAAAAVAAVVFALPTLGDLGDLADDLRYQGVLAHRLGDAVGDAGGRERLLACGKPYTGAFLVPAVAWQLHVHTSTVGLLPRAPAVVFRVRTTRGDRSQPTLRALRGPQRTLATAAGWRIVGSC